MKVPQWIRTDVSLRLVLLTSVGMGGVSCSLPPREAWQRMREEGVLKAFFVPKRSGVTDDRTQRLAGADLSVDGDRSRALPVAEPAAQSGFVYSPRTTPRKLVNVKDFAPGDTVLCPYTMEPFVIPGAVAPSDLANTPTTVPVPSTRTSTEPTPSKLAGAGHSSGASEPTNPAVQEVSLEGAQDHPAISDSSIALSDAPFGTWVEGKPGHVYSPFAERHQLVDVTGIAPGTEVHCPFTQRIFRVPEIDSAPTSLAQSLPEPSPGEEPSTGGLAATIPPASEDAAAESESPDLRSLASVEPASEPGPPASTPAGVPLLTTPAADPTLAASQQPAPPAPLPSAPKYGATTPATPMPLEASAPLAVENQTAAPKAPDKAPPVKKAPTPPTATWVPNRPGLVQSPYGKPGELVDVTGKPSGSKVVCPYTNKPFLVPKP